MRQKVTNWGLYPQIVGDNFTPTTYEEVCDIADEMTEDEIIELGFYGEEDFYDYINQAFTLDEA